MSRVEHESYQTRTVGANEYGEKAVLPDNDNVAANHETGSSSAEDENATNGILSQYGTPAGYAGESVNHHLSPVVGGYQAGAPPIAPSDAEIDALPGARKRVCDAYILGLALGFFGAHHFYLKRHGFGVAYFFTFGFLGCGYLADLFRMPLLVSRYNKTRAKGKADPVKRLDDAYVCWFPLGLFGAHHFYLGRVGWGMLYLFTVGLFGIGWLIDGFYLPILVKRVNKQNAKLGTLGEIKQEKSAYIAWLLSVFPFSGLLGAHHYYLGNYIVGLFYTLTLGNLGIGYVVDWFRTPVLVKRTNLKNSMERAYLDEAYIFAFPLGFLGMHHFYLKRYGWGVLYFFTLGCLGVGWLLDLCRMPCLVRDYNKLLEGKESSGGANQGSDHGHVNVVAQLPDPVNEQEKAMEASAAEAMAGGISHGGPPGIFSTNLQPNYPYPPHAGYAYNDQIPPHGYVPPTSQFYNIDPNIAEGGIPYPGQYPVQHPGQFPGQYPGQVPGQYPPQYSVDQDGLPSYNDAITNSTIESSIVSSQGDPTV